MSGDKTSIVKKRSWWQNIRGEKTFIRGDKTSVTTKLPGKKMTAKTKRPERCFDFVSILSSQISLVNNGSKEKDASSLILTGTFFFNTLN